jgi:glycosyltransferase involved in cell wall biosynthesis
MKLGFDAKRIFYNHTGLGNYSRGIIENLHQFYENCDIHLFTPTLKTNLETNAFQEKLTIHTASIKPFWYWRTFKMVKDLEKQDIDIYHGLTHELPKGIHKSKIKSVLTVHDLIFKIYPQQYKFIDRKIYDWKLKYACKAADVIVAISEHTKRDIIKYYDIPAKKIEVIYQTCDERFKIEASQQEKKQVQIKHKLPKQFLLSVGSIIERKNLLTLVKAMKTVDIPLVVVGSGKDYKKKVETYIQEYQLENKIIFLKNVSNEDLATLYQLATIFIYPSIYEGFGIPLIEAIFSKTPVITTTLSALPEAGGKFSHYVSGTDTEELSTMINELLSDEIKATENLQKSFDWASEQFSPKNTAKQLHQLYKRLISSSYAQ